MGQYEQIVALEAEAQAAAAAGRDEAAIRSHRQALEIAQELNRPGLLAALFSRMGATLEASGRIQDALIAYESGWRATLADDGPADLDQVLERLDVPTKTFEPDRFYGMDSVPDLYREAANRDLAAAEASPTLRIGLLINIGNAYLRQSQEDPALYFYKTRFHSGAFDFTVCCA
jgi:tetratricopeptide (TPR) repeat protein